MDQAAADLNNVGVAYLERGDLRKALDLFRSALRTTMGEMRPPPVVPPPMPPAPQLPNAVNAEHSDARMIDSSYYGEAQGEATAQHQHQHQHSQREDKPPEFSTPGTSFIHAQGFGIVGTTGAYSPDPLVNTTVVSILIIFNLAVIYHLKGLHEKALNESRLHKARALYVKANLLLHDAGVTFGSTGNAVVDLLSMAVSNNMAHVSYELASYEESREHFDALIRFALTVVPGRYGDTYIGSIMDQQKSNFLLNAIILHAPNLAPAA